MLDGSGDTSETGQDHGARPASSPLPRLTTKQKEILQAIVRGIQKHRPPTNRELREEFGLKAPAGVLQHLRALEKKGLIQRRKGAWRGIELADGCSLEQLEALGVNVERPVTTAVTPNSTATPRLPKQQGATQRSPREPALDPPSYVNIPILGRIAAGQPIDAQEDVEGWLPLPREDLGPGTFFMLRVQGWSMYEAGIFDNDLVIVRYQQAARNGDIVAAQLESYGPEDSATVKYYSDNGTGNPLLLPANPNEKEIDARGAYIAGKVIGILRWLKHSQPPIIAVGRAVVPPGGPGSNV
jgi:repressor LexA